MFAKNDGVKIWYEIHGEGESTFFLIPGFQIAHSETFKLTYLPFLSRHMRVVTMDLRGNGKSDRPEGGYDLKTYVKDVEAVVDAAQLTNFSLLGLSLGAKIILNYYQLHKNQVGALIFLSGGLGPFDPDNYPVGTPIDFLGSIAKAWKHQPNEMLKGFVEASCNEKYSLRIKEYLNEWAHKTTPEIWQKCFDGAVFSDATNFLQDIDIPVLIIHGENDQLISIEEAKYIHAKIPKSKLITIPQAGHGFIKTWPRVNMEILTFLKPETYKHSVKTNSTDKVNILWVSSPIGLGHIKRDLAIGKEIKKQIPNSNIEWLVVEPAIKFLKGEREPIHPYSHFLFNENESFESWGKDFVLDPIEVIWNISKQLNANFMVFIDAIHQKQYDLIVGDESWEILEYLGHNDMLKTAPFVFITDVIGSASINNDQQQNARVKDMIRRFIDIYDDHARSIDLSIYIGRPEDIPDQPFHPEIPINRRDWTKKHFQFPGYILPFDTNECKDRQLLRNEQSYLDEEIIILVSVGGTGLGLPLIQKCLEAYQIIKETNSNYRMIVICGPRIEHEFENTKGVEFKSFVQDPIGLYSSCDVGIIQGGLTTSMEMTALGCPFIYFPLIDHFEQQLFVDFRLNNYNAGIRMDYNDASPSDLAEKILEILNTPINYLPVNNDGAQKATNMIIDLMKAGK